MRVRTGITLTALTTTVAALLVGTASAAAGAASATAPAAATSGSLYHSVSSTLVANTTTAAAGSLHVKVAGVGNVPATGVSAVTLRVTATEPKKPGYLTAFQDGAIRPGVSTLNFVVGRTAANLSVVQVGADGKVDIYNGSAGTVRILAELTGYYTASTSTGDVAGGFVPTPPTRVLDTRSKLGASTPAAGAGITVPVAGRAGVPATGAGSVVLNLTTTRPTKPGYVTAYADGAARPGTASVTFAAGTTVANLAVVPIGADGRVRLDNGSTKAVDVLADVAGYFRSPGDSAASTTGAYVPITPTRLVDTRTSLGTTTPGAKGTVSATVAGRAGLPAGVATVVVDLTATRATRNGFVTVWPDAAPRPNTASIDFTAGTTVSNLAVVPVATDGRISLYNGAPAAVDLQVDAVGYVAASPAAHDEVPPLPAGPKASGEAPGGTSCWAAGHCVVLRHNATQAFADTVVRQPDGTTITSRAVLPGPARFTNLSWGVVSCASAACNVVRNFRGTLPNPDPEVDATEAVVLYTRNATSGAWTAKTVSQHGYYRSDSGDPVYSGLSCVSPGECVAVDHETDPEFPDISRSNAVTVHAGRTTLSTLGDGHVTDVSCRTVADCVATGYDYVHSGAGDVNYGRAPVVYHLTGVTWTRVVVAEPAPVEAGYDHLACRPGGSCLAVGSTIGSTYGFTPAVPVAATVTATGVPTAAAAPPFLAGGLSCATTVCRAVGVDGDSLKAATFDGSTWTGTGIPGPGSGVENPSYTALSCASDTDCLATGTARATVQQPLLSTFASGAWASSAPALTSGSPVGGAAAVSCLPGSTCVTVGTYQTVARSATTYAQVRTSSGWGSAVAVNTQLVHVHDLSCTATTSCVAVGAGATVARLSGTTWTDAQLPAASAGDPIDVAGVSCTAPGACVAFGDNGGPVAWTLASGTWTAQSLSPPDGLTREVAAGISCSSAGHCVAVGDAIRGDGYVQGVFHTLAGGGWTPSTLPEPWFGDRYLLGISCSSDALCTAVGPGAGYYTLDQGVAQRNQAAGGDFLAVSCSADGTCTIAGRGLASAFVARRAGTDPAPVTPVAPPNGEAGPAPLADVSCSTATFCVAVGRTATGGPYAVVLD